MTLDPVLLEGTTFTFLNWNDYEIVDGYRINIIGVGLKPANQFTAHPQNPKYHPPEQREGVRGALGKFGWADMVKENVQTGYVLDGHERVWSAMSVAEDSLVPYMLIDIPPQEEGQFLLMFDRAGHLARWDEEVMQDLFDEFTLGDGRLDRMLKDLASEHHITLGDPPGAPPEDQAPKVSEGLRLVEKWGVDRGQTWQLGDHRLVCGDSRSGTVVEELMNGDYASMTFTSPPYNMGISSRLDRDMEQDNNLYIDEEYDDNQTEDAWYDLMVAATEAALLNSEYVFINVQSLAGNKKALIEYLHFFVDNFADVIVWDKGSASPAMGRRITNSRFEFVYVFSQAANRAIGTKDFRGTVDNVYSAGRQLENQYSDVHSATFPLHLPEHFINNFTNPSEIVLDPFCGTGTTIIACERTGRVCRAVELSPVYCAVTLERWYDVTKTNPVLMELSNG